MRHFYFKETSGLHYRTTYSIDSTKAEILIFGASRANHHYVPEIFEDSCKKSFYNTGRDGSGTFYQLALEQAVLKRYKPKIIIFEYSSVFSKGQYEYDQMSSLLPYFKDHEEIRSMIELRSPFEKIRLLSEIYPFNSQALTITIGNSEINKKRAADNKGYIALYKKWPLDLDSVPDKKIVEIDSNKVNAFTKCITTAKDSGIEVFIVYSPIFQKFNKNQEVDLCRKICTEKGVPFWDFSKDTLFLNNKQLFQDTAHLNNEGAMKFSKLVASKIIHYSAN